jgi:nucleosome assembly protein 1-like 1
MKYDYEEQFTDALKSITDNNLKKKLVAIKKLVCERMSLEKDFKKEHNKLDYKYEQLYKPFYERRQKIIEGEEKPDFEKIREKLAELKINEEEAKKEKEDEKGIPEFWYKVLLNNQDIMLNERDKDVLKKLKLIKCTPEENGNFSLEFFFEPNDYFTNEVLKREFILDEDCDIKEIKSDEIQWKSDAMNTTIEIKQKKVKNKRTKQVKTITKKEKIPSFFSSFKHFEKKEGENKEEKDEEDEDEEGEELTIDDEYDMALQYKEEIIPYAIEYYLGIADDGEDLPEEDEEDEEEEEPEEKPKYKGGKKPDFHHKKKY